MSSTDPNHSLRGIQFLLAHPQLLQTQCRAILRASAWGNVRVMLPLVSRPEEVMAFRALWDAALRNTTSLGTAAAQEALASTHSATRPSVGMMAETPALVGALDLFSGLVDFVSIGSNDLAALSFASDRALNTGIHSALDDFQPALWRMLRALIEQAHSQSLPVTLCGQLASQPQLTELLLGLGLTNFSCTLPCLEAVKERVRKTNLASAQEFAKHVMQLRCAEDVQKALEDRGGESHHPVSPYFIRSVG